MPWFTWRLGIKFHKDIQYTVEKLGKSKFGFERTLKAKDTRALGTRLLIIPGLRVLVLTKRQVGSRNEIGRFKGLAAVFLTDKKR